MRGRPALPLAERIKKATMRTQPKGMFQRFTDRARRVVVLAQEEARLLHHQYVGTEHILLGLLYEAEGVAARALESLGINRQAVRQQVEQTIGQGRQPPSGHIPFAPGAKKMLELSLREALALGHNYVGTEHLLLAMLREGQDVVGQVLTRRGISHAQVRERVLGLLAGECGREDPQAQLAADLADAAEQLTQVRRDKEAAFDAGDLEAAAALRDQEKQLLADKQGLENQLTIGVAGQAILAENQRLRRELERLRDLLRQHGIEPDSGTARPA
jgi:ATP-dependent Clp protease ATP-binding subunit ClpA